MIAKIGTRSSTFSFTLVEVVLAVGVCSFVLVAILGLFTIGLQSNHDSEQQIQAANLASMLISVRTASPLNDIPNLPNFAIPTSAMSGPYQNAYDGGATLTKYVGLDGQIAATPTDAAYAISCRAGTNLVTGSAVAQVYLMLTWPPQADPKGANAGHYEVIADIPLR
jgi:type II secretory pathway pseudopilin PulG